MKDETEPHELKGLPGGRESRFMPVLSRGVVLLILWCALSGHDELLLLGLGGLSIALVLWLTLGMEVINPGEHPYQLQMRPLAAYWAWLLWEICKSGLEVSRRILSPQLPISPRLLQMRCGLQSDLGRTIYANSITLTPGTITVHVDQDRIEIHSLSGAAQVLESGEMERRVATLEEKLH